MKTMIQGSIPGMIMRGGTSNGFFVTGDDFNVPESDRSEFLLEIFGSPDSLQVDGIGGGKSHNSKFISVKSSDSDRYELEYTYAQVGVEEPMVDWKKISGNLTSGVGMFALLNGLVTATGDATTISIYNTNTDMRIDQRVPLRDGEPDVYGDYSISGVSGTGALIKTTFHDPTGRITGSLLPTGNAIDTITFDDHQLDVSVVDATNLVAYLRASDLGLTGTELPPDLAAQDVLSTIDRVREEVSTLIDIEGDEPVIAVGLISEPQTYTGTGGVDVQSSDINVTTRFFSLQPHHAIGTSSAMCTGAAVRTPGTIPAEYSSGDGHGEITIGHPKGTITVEVDGSNENDDTTIESITNYRTARPLIAGDVFYRYPDRFSE